MAVLIRGAALITGDGETQVPRADILLERGKIEAIDSSGTLESGRASGAEIINADGFTVIPGIINAHAHGCIFGPSMPSGSRGLTPAEVDYNCNRHLLQGTTTLLNVCGMAFPEELYDGKPHRHPLDVHVSTAHTIRNLEAATIVDGTGLSERHRKGTIDDLLALGAKALGEAGGGQTLGGGAQEYKFIPAAIKNHLGISVDPSAARRLKNAVLGRSLDPDDGVPDQELEEILKATDLAGIVGPDTIRAILIRSVMPSVATALAGFDEIASESFRVGYPAIFHCAVPTASRLISLAEKFPKAHMIAGHSNHPSFHPAEAVGVAQGLRERGVVIDVSTLDCVLTRWRNEPDNFDALIESGLVDTISTDFAGGHWDGILEAVHRIVRRKQLSVPAAVAMATGNVARSFPQLAGDRGRVETGKRADLVIVDSANLGRVRDVFIAGNAVVRNGSIINRQIV